MGEFNDVGAFLDVRVNPATYTNNYFSQSAYPNISRGSSAIGFINYYNRGNMAWYDDTSLASAPAGTKPVHLATTSPINRSSALGSAWGGDRNRPAVNFAAVYESDGTTLAANQHVVQPGQIAKFNINFTAPSNLGPGTYRERFNIVLEGVGEFNDVGAFLDVRVN